MPPRIWGPGWFRGLPPTSCLRPWGRQTTISPPSLVTGVLRSNLPGLGTPALAGCRTPVTGRDGLLPIGSNYQFSVPISPDQTQRFFRIRNCDYGLGLVEPGSIMNGYGYHWTGPDPHEFRHRNGRSPNQHLVYAYAGPSVPPGLAVPASQGSPSSPRFRCPRRWLRFSIRLTRRKPP